MEFIQDVRMKLYIKTNKRTIEKEFEPIFDMKLFIDRFFMQRTERRLGKPCSGYKRSESRMQA